jgi:hypothetical protein
MIAVLPWDADIFHFNVATLKIEHERQIAAHIRIFAHALERWAKRTHTEVISVSISSDNSALLSVLQQAQFRVVELSLHPQHMRFQTIKFPASRLPIRLVTAKDLPAIERIAAHGFSFGRYHTDARFPNTLANQRYRQWIKNVAINTDSSRIYVVENKRHILGFHHIELIGTHADLRLAAIDRSKDFLGAGLSLYSGSLAAIQKLGIRTAEASISAANTNIANMFVNFGFQLKKPEYVLHWHAPHAKHLI